MNNNFFNKRKIDKTMIKYVITSILVVGTCALLTYFATDRLINSKDESDNIVQGEDRFVYNTTNKLEDDLKLTLMVANEVFLEQTLNEFKNDNNIEVDVTEQFLINFLEAQGFEIVSLAEEKIVFNKEKNENELVANKFYLGEKDGYFAIYKTDSQGRAFIESDSDVFREYKKVNTIPVSAEEDIKNLKHYYDTKGEALERLAGYLN